MIKNYLQRRAERRVTKEFYRVLDSTIEMCKTSPRKYYIVKKNASEFEVISSKEFKKLKRFPVARKDKAFNSLPDRSFIVSPENLSRLIQEQLIRRRRWWADITSQRFVPVTKAELRELKKYRHNVIINNLIKKHE